MPSPQLPPDDAVAPPRDRPWLRLPGALRWLRRRRIRSSIGLRLALLALALGLPFVVYVGGNAAVQAAHERDEAKQRTLSLARLFALRIDDYVSDMAGALALVGYGVTMEQASAGSNDAFLRRIQPDLPRSVNNVGIWTLDGRNIGALDRAHITEDINVADRAYFRRALETGKLAIDGPLTSRANHEPIVMFARRVLGEDRRPLGVVTVSAKLRDLGWLLDLKGAAPRGTVVSFVNADGIVLARNLEPERWIGASVKGIGNASAHLASREGVDETRGADNVERIAGYTVADLAGWHVFVGAPADATLSAARTNFVEMLLYGTLSLLFGALFAARLGTRIARPLRTLAHDAMLFARGNLAHRTNVAGDDETGVLAATFNRMAQTLAERTQALHDKTAALELKTQALTRTTAELSTITANVPVLIAYVDASETFRFVNEYVRDVFGVAPADVVGCTLREMLGGVVHARLEGRMRDVLAGMPQAFEATFAPEGPAPLFLVTCFPDYGDGGAVLGAYVVCQDITRRKEAENALEARERFIRLIADAVPARITYSDTSERLRFGNKRFAEYWDTDPQAIVGRRVADVVSPAAYAQIAPELVRSYRGETRRFDLVVDRADGTQYYQVDHVPDFDANGVIQGIVTISQDVTDLRDAHAKAEASEQRLRRITDNIPSMIAYIDRGRHYRFNSRYYESWIGRPLAEITGRHLRDVMGADAYAEVRPNLDRAFTGERVDFDVEVPQPAGESRFVRGTYIPDFDSAGQVIGVYSSSTDVTPLKKVERQLEQLAQHDTLTGLPNRHTFNDAIATALARSQRTGMQVALLFLDIDGFKRINDTLGHGAGDDVLREFARRLTGAVRSTDLVARLAGDEFVIILEGIHTREECRFVARKIIASMRGDFRAGDGVVTVTTSIGIALGHGLTSTPDLLLKRADSALYAAKGHGRDTFEIAI